MCVLALHHGELPPTANYEHPTPSATSTTCRTRRARSQVDVALSNAMGLGGHNALRPARPYSE